MASIVVGLFDTHAQADNTVRKLIEAGVTPGQISVVAADPSGIMKRRVEDREDEMPTAGAAAGAASGLVVGGLVGLFVGAVVLAAPPAGILLAGPVAGFLAGAGIGAVSGGMIGALAGIGISENDAHIYAESIRRGGTVLTAEVEEMDRVWAENILSACGAVSVSERGELYRQEGFTAYDPAAPLYTEDQIALELARRDRPLTTLPTQDTIVIEPSGEALIVEGNTREDAMVPVGMDSEFRQHFMTSERGITGLTFEDLRPAYRFGYEIAEQPEYRSQPWEAVLPSAKQTWEHLNPGTWERVTSAVHFGWNCYAPSTPIQRPNPGMGEAKVL